MDVGYWVEFPYADEGANADLFRLFKALRRAKDNRTEATAIDALYTHVASMDPSVAVALERVLSVFDGARELVACNRGKSSGTFVISFVGADQYWAGGKLLGTADCLHAWVELFELCGVTGVRTEAQFSEVDEPIGTTEILKRPRTLGAEGHATKWRYPAEVA